MIEALKATIRGTELASLCIESVDYHDVRHAVCTNTLQALKNDEAAAGDRTNDDPQNALNKKATPHTHRTAEIHLLSGVGLAKTGVLNGDIGPF